MKVAHPTIVGAYEAASFPKNQVAEIHAYVRGMEQGLDFSDNPGEDPTKVSVEFRSSGNCHIWVIRGKWEGSDAVFPEIPWEPFKHKTPTGAI